MNGTATTPARPARRVRSLLIASALFTGIAVSGSGPAPVATAQTTVDPNMVPVVSARLLETRNEPGLETIDGNFNGQGKIRARSFLKLDVAGRGGVDPDADAVMLNVTAILPEGPGYLTVYPCTPKVPHASNVNYFTGDVTPNSVLAKLSDDGAVCIFTLATSHVVVDVNGYIPAGGAPITVDPARLVETRGEAEHITIDGISQRIGRAPARTTIEFRVTGRGNVPLNAEAVFLNVTAILPNAAGFLTVFPCGSPRPETSNVNYRAGDVTPNSVLATVGEGGKVCIYTLAAADIIADVNGYLPPGGARVSIQPARCADTRTPPDGKTFDGRFQGAGPIAAGGTYAITIAGRCRIAPDASAAYLNVTAVFPEGPGFLTVWPCDQPRPNASNVNYLPGEVRPNAALSKVSLDGNGQICVFSLARTNIIVDVTGYVPVAALRGITDIAPGFSHTCALTNTRDVNCWGSTAMLGIGVEDTFGERGTPQRVPIGPATDITSSHRHSCAVLANGTARCWGHNPNGELGDGTDEGVGSFKIRFSPVAVKNLTGVTDIAAGLYHTCATTNDGKVWCWGYNWERQLGDGTNVERHQPVQVNGLPAGKKAIQVSAGRSVSCALFDDGTIACWGHSGILGGGPTSGSDNLPAVVLGVTTATAIASGEGHTCARLGDGTVTCWGMAVGAGRPDGTGSDNIPAVVAGVTGAADISAGGHSTCALLSNGTARCWGSNSYGGLGNGNTTDSRTPVQMQGYNGTLTAVGVGNHHSCAVLADTTAVCYGYNSGSPLGGGQGPHSTTPVVVGSVRPT